MIEAEVLNFNAVCQSFPKPPTSLIHRDNFLNSIETVFEGDIQIFVVEGEEGVGKTTLLSQFAMKHPYNALSLFIRSTSRWAYDPDSLRFDLCNQLHWYFTKEELGTTQGIDDGFLRNGWLQLQKYSRRYRESFYFVIDGLDDIPEEESYIRKIILDMLPLGHSGFLFLLAGTPDKILPNISSRINRKTSVLTGFTFHETLEYLKDLSLDRESIKEVHESCRGIPSHLASVRRILQTGMDVHTLLENMPDKLPGLFEVEWRRVKNDDRQLKLLAIMAYDHKKHSIDDLGRLLNLDMPTVQSLLQDLGFITMNLHNSEVGFISEAFRKFVAGQLRRFKEEVRNLLIDDLFKLPNSEAALTYLPGYLEQAERFEDLINYLSLDNFTILLERSQSLGPLRQMAQLGIRAARQLRRDGDLVLFCLQRSAMANLKGVEIWRSEIEARMVLNDYDAALALAQKTILKEDRLHLLAIIARKKREQGLLPEAELTEQIRQLYDQIERTVLGERAIEIASDLMHCYPDLAIKLVEEATNSQDDENALDWAFAKLSLATLGSNREQFQEPEAIDLIRSHIKDPDALKLSSTASVLLNNYSASQVIAEAEKFESTGDALHLLSLWAMENREQLDAAEVVEFGLKLAIKTTAYSPNARVLRQIATPLPYIPDESKAKQLIDNFDSQKGTIEHLGPTVDYVRLQLLLAKAVSKCDFEAACDRIIDTYFYIASLDDLAIKTECLAWLVGTVASIDPQMTLESKEGIHSLAQDDLMKNINWLLDTTAFHYEVTRGIIKALAQTKRDIALDLTQRLNTEERRDKALLNLLKTLIRVPVSKIELTFVQNTLSYVADPALKDEIVVKVMARLARASEKMESVVTNALPIISRVKDIQDARMRCNACCFAFSFLTKQDASKYRGLISDLLNHLKLAWQSIDVEWEKINTGFKIATSISSGSMEEAQNYLGLTEKLRNEIVLEADTIASTYLSCLRLAIRSYKGLLPKNLDSEEDIENLGRFIDRIASNGIRARLWAELALIYHNNDRNKKCEFIVNQYVKPLLENISLEDAHFKNLITIAVAPALYCAHKQIALELVSELPKSVRDDAFWVICRFICNKQLPSDPYDYVPTKGYKLTYSEVVEICTLLELVESDVLICYCIETVADSMLGQSNNKFSFLQKNDIVSRFEKIIANKLPNPKGIKHDGYKIVALGQVARIQQASSQMWIDLCNLARNVPNLADKAYVLAKIAIAMPRRETSRRNRLLDEVKEIIEQIPGTSDKIKRYRSVADMIRDREPSIFREYLKLAMLATLSIDVADAYSSQKKIIDLAYRQNPSFAASLASLVNDDPARVKLKQRLDALDLQTKMVDQRGVEHEVSNTDPEPTSKSNYSQAAWTLMGALNAETAAELHINRLRDFIQIAASLPLDKSYPILAWVLENTIKCYARTDQASRYLRPIYEALLIGTELLGRTAVHSLEQLKQSKGHTIKTPDNSVRLFRAGERDGAIQFLKDWLANYVRNYLKICDQYFGPDELDALQLLLSVKPDCKVYILTSKKHQDSLGIGMDCGEAYRTSWHVRFVQEPPDTEILIIGTKSNGESPIHDRWWVTDGGGISIGTSYNGLGVKDSTITLLSPGDAETLEKDMDQYYFGNKREYKGEKLLRSMFSLY